MKIFFTFTFLLWHIVGTSQTPSSITIACTDSGNVPDYTYFADLEGKLDAFVGTWKYTNGNEIVTFRISKISQKYFPNEKIFRDILIGDYSYTVDSGVSYLVNSISLPVNPNPYEHPMYTPCVENTMAKFIFRDLVLNKGFCYATFTFLPGSTTQLQVQIRNPAEIPGRIEGEPPYNYNFSIPTDVIVIKQ